MATHKHAFGVSDASRHHDLYGPVPDVRDEHPEPQYHSGLQRFIRKWGRWYLEWMREYYLTREDAEGCSREGVYDERRSR